MKTLFIFLYLVPFVSSGQTTKNLPKFQYKDAIEHFLTNANKSFLPENDTVYFMHIDKTDADTLPKLVNTYHLTFISWEEVWVLLKRKATLKVYEIITGKFEEPSYLINFLPATISNEVKRIERDFNNICTLVYKKQEKSTEFTFKNMRCGMKAIM